MESVNFIKLLDPKRSVNCQRKLTDPLTDYFGSVNFIKITDFKGTPVLKYFTFEIVTHGGVMSKFIGRLFSKS